MTPQQPKGVSEVEALMRPRKKVIAPYPGSPFNDGNILYYDDEKIEAGFWYSTSESGQRFYIQDPHLYPHLFKPLAWWEEREATEMPEYVKAESGKIFLSKWKIKEALKMVLYDAPNELQCEEYYVTPKVMCFFEPATESEYTEYLKQKL